MGTHIRIVLALAAIMVVAGPRMASAADPVNVSDVGAVEATSGQVPFIVSLNDDHDDGKKTPDMERNGAPPSAKDDNLREVRFVPPPGGNFVMVYKPLNVANNTPAIGDKIRAWDEPKKAAFQFDVVHDTAQAKPLVVFFEGIKTTKVDGVAFEFAYFKDKQMKDPVGGGSALLTVVRVSLDRNGHRGLVRNEKLLATGTITATASVTPRVPSARYEWLFSNNTTGNIAPVAGNPLQATFTATNQWTALYGQDRVIFRITDTRQAGAPILATAPISVTAPRSVTARPATLAPAPAAVSTQGLDNPKKVQEATFAFFKWVVTYPVYDQFNQPIYDSDKGDNNVEAFVHEDVAITSTDPGLRGYLNEVRTTPQWKAIRADGTFFDNLNLKDVSMSAVMSSTPGNFHITTGPAGATIISMPHHVWHVTLAQDATLDKTVTDNALTVIAGPVVRVSNYETTSYSSTYTISTPP